MRRFLPFVPLFVVFSVGCASHDAPSNQVANQSGGSAANSPDATTPVGNPQDYFPTAPGTRWEYTIALPDKSVPLQYRVTEWSMGDQQLSSTERSRLLGAMIRPGGTYHLVLQVKGPTAKEGALAYPNGTELAVVKDDLGVYEDCDHLYWAATSDSRYMVTMVATYSPESSSAPSSSGTWGTWGADDGSAMRVVFFGDKPGTRIGMGDDDDTLEFVGVDNGQLHFFRQVKASSEKGDTASEIDKGFSEDMWFERGVGLNRLEQRINNKLTMTWDLTKFTPGSEN